MGHFLFEDLDTGEQIIIGEMTKDIARKVVFEIFDNPKYLGELTEEEAEASGLDEY